MGRDPFEVMGLPAGPLSLEAAYTVLALEHPELEEEAEADREATKVRSRMDLEEALSGGGGYEGPRPLTPIPPASRNPL